MACIALLLIQFSLIWKSVDHPVRMPTTTASEFSQMRLTFLTFSQVFAIHCLSQSHYSHCNINRAGHSPLPKKKKKKEYPFAFTSQIQDTEVQIKSDPLIYHHTKQQKSLRCGGCCSEFNVCLCSLFGPGKCIHGNEEKPKLSWKKKYILPSLLSGLLVKSLCAYTSVVRLSSIGNIEHTLCCF